MKITMKKQTTQENTKLTELLKKFDEYWENQNITYSSIDVIKDVITLAYNTGKTDTYEEIGRGWLT
jgi:hypothetical protein